MKPSFAEKFSGKRAGALLFTLAAALGLWFFISANLRKEAIGDISRSLVTINSYKEAQLSAWHDDHLREAGRLSRHPFMGEIVSEEISRPGSRRRQLTVWLEDHSVQKRYSSMAFLSVKGAVIAATSGYSIGTEKQFTEAFAQASQKGTALLTDLYLAAAGRPRMTMLSPISAGGRGGKPQCVLVANIDPGKKFYPLLKAAPLFFVKAETLLVRKEGEEVLYLNELDYSKNSALKLRLPISDEQLPAAAALSGHSGFFEGVDYRGVKVFSAMGFVQGSNWAVITKIDQDIILAPVKSRESLALALILLAAGLLYGGVYIVLGARRRAADTVLAQAQSELQRERALLKSIIDVNPYGIQIYDAEGHHIRANQAFLAMFHSAPPPEYCFFDDPIAAKAGLREVNLAIKEGKIHVTPEMWFNAHLIYPEMPDMPVCFRSTVFPVMNAFRKMEYFAVMYEDITALKQAELEMKKLNLDLVEKKKEMENFLYITTHDLRGPLVNIQGFSRNLERYASELRVALEAAALPPELKKTLDKIAGESIPGALKYVLESLRKMDSLIMALLKVSRLGRVEMKPETVEMNELLEKLRTSMQYQLEESGGELRSGNLPPCKADPGAVSQLFSNLLDNAVKYRDKGRPLVVTVEGEVKGGMVTYAVTDNGSGIPTADLHRIWNIFYQPARVPGREGEGIGLPMVRLIAEKNGGGIRAESKDGLGTVFYLELPAVGQPKAE